MAKALEIKINAVVVSHIVLKLVLGLYYLFLYRSLSSQKVLGRIA